MSGGGEEETTLEDTPTWVVALVCTVIIAISLTVKRFLHFGGKFLKKRHQKPLYEALQKIKEELMLLGFISLLRRLHRMGLPKFVFCWVYLAICFLVKKAKSQRQLLHPIFEFILFPLHFGTVHRLLAEGSSSSSSYCGRKHKVPLLSVEAIHHLHILIFVLAVVHVTFCVLTVLFGGLKICQWKHWEDSIAKDNYEARKDSFFKQFFGSVTKLDYVTLRHGFIQTHCRSNPKFNFYEYMIRALEDDFKQVVSISWYHWMFVVIFLLLNVNAGIHIFWMELIPFFLLLAVGAKLEHVRIQLAHEVAGAAIEGELVVQPSDDHFWFHRPHIVLFWIHFILFQNSFETTFFFWIWVSEFFWSIIYLFVVFVISFTLIALLQKLYITTLKNVLI